MASKLSTISSQSNQEGPLDRAFRLILLRNPTENERVKFTAYVQNHGLANACQVLLNSNEFLYLD